MKVTGYEGILSAFLLCCFATPLTVDTARVPLPSHTECEDFAMAGSCVNSAQYMEQYCGHTCDDLFRRQRLERLERPTASSFFELTATDIDGNEVDFSIFSGKVTVVINVASECGFTEDHYNEMNALYRSLSSTGRFELVAFPCNQFDEQEPGDQNDIKEFTAQKGVQFKVMDMIDVNGRRAHDVYRFLKNAAGQEQIEWNFATYFVISPDGGVEAFNGVTPLQLRASLASLLKLE